MDPFVAEIRIFPFNFAPKGWAFCDGQILPLAQNTALFSLLGTTYGGDGKSNFALPNLQGRVPLCPDQGPGLTLRNLGEHGGSSAVTLLPSQVPSHAHDVQVTDVGDSKSPIGNIFGVSQARAKSSGYASNGSPSVNMASDAVGNAGSGAPHNNMPPYLTLNFCIALQGVYPPRS